MHLNQIVKSVLTGLLLVCSVTTSAFSDDWPTWRKDSTRSASTPEQLATELHLQWSQQFPALRPAWPEDARLHFDATYQPIVMGETMFVSSSRNDSVTAINTVTGERRWRFFADGPVRFAPVARKGKVYFGADDGCLYCLDADKRTLLWKFSAVPSSRKVIGNERLISVWPMRGGPVFTDDGKLCFTVGVWPFEGTLLYTLDPASGTQIDSDGADFRYSSVTLKDQSPQGYLVLQRN